MRVDVTPRKADIVPGQAMAVVITITNNSLVIGGYAIRVLGADPGWVQLDADQVSLFPDESRTVTATITAPHGIPAGLRRIAVQVRELTPPQATSITAIDLTVPSDRSVQVRLDPVAVTAGRRASFSLLVENTGNSTLRARLAGEDPEGRVRFHFEPTLVSLGPGEHAVVDLHAEARRPIAGSPTVRVLNVFLDELPADLFDRTRPPPEHEDRAAVATGTFLQRSLLTRGALSLLGLLAAVTVFAIVITVAMSRLVGQSAADRDLALQVAAARNAGSEIGTSGIAGQVRLLTSKKPVPGVSVVVFAATNTASPLATTATDDQGRYAVTNLASGQYKISFRGAGFVQLWYPGATSDADATIVRLAPGQQLNGLNVTLGGVPATISGTVSGEDVSTAKLYLETTSVTSTTGVAPNAQRAEPIPQPPGPPDNGSAVVQSVPIGGDGAFTLTNVPSPSIYLLVVVKTGYATSTQRIDVGAGEHRTGVALLLRKGDGLISGTVSDASGPLPDVTITATAGQSTASTVSLTEGTPGAFTLRQLPTPASFTVVATKTGYATQTLTLTLSAGQKLTGVAMMLGQSAGSLRGTVTSLPSNRPAAGVSVTITDGLLTVHTETESTEEVGAWKVGGLPVPGTYTVTFSRSDLAAQTVSVSLDPSGRITPGSVGTQVTNSGIAVSMKSATATVYGTVTQRGGATVCDAQNHLAEATVTLSAGTTSYTVTSARNKCGQYRIEHVPPGTYTLTVSSGTGTSPTALVVRLAAGDVVAKNVTLAQPAAIRGKVVSTDPSAVPRPGWTVFLYRGSQYPTTVLRTTVTAADGTFAFQGLDAGDYIIAVGPTSDAGNAVTTKTVTVRPSTLLDNVVIEADPSG